MALIGLSVPAAEEIISVAKETLMDIRKLSASTPFRVTAAIVLGVAVIAGLAFAGSGAQPAEWRSQLAQDPSDNVIRADGDRPGGVGARAIAVLNETNPDAAGSDPVRVQGDGTGQDGGGGGTAGDTSGQTGTPGDPQGGSTGGDTDTPQDPGTTPQGPVMTVRIKWWNDTVSTPPEAFQVILSQKTWSPSDMSADSETGRLTGIPVGSRIVLHIYPDGPDGTRIAVPVELIPAMLPDSEEDAIHVAVSDREVRVVGTPVLDFDVIAPRF